MAETLADFLIERLMEWGVSRIYGYPGDGINGISAALRKGGDSCDFVQVRREEAAERLQRLLFGSTPVTLPS